jgi:hypothetical protein
LPSSICTYDDTSLPTAYATYTYTVQDTGTGLSSNKSTAYQINTYIDPNNPSAIFSLFTPDANLSVTAAAQALGYDHFDWVQVITHEPSCDPLHLWDPATAYPTKGAAVVAPHLDPPLGGYYEFGFYEEMCGSDHCAGPSDNLPYYYDENPNTGDPLLWFMYAQTTQHEINPGGTLDSDMAGGLQSSHIMARFYDEPKDSCITGSEYMGFVNTLVGVKTGVGVVPSTYDALNSYVWSSNYNSRTGGVKRQSSSNWEIPYDPTANGGVFGVAPVDFDSLPDSVRGVMSQNGGQNISSTSPPVQIPPTTGAFLTGTVGANGWYTSPVQVSLVASDVNGPSSIAGTTYSLDGGATMSYSAPFPVTADGVHTVVYGSTDTSGGVETPRRSTTFSIDRTPPASRVSALPATESSASFTLQWSGSDALSGIQSYTIYVSDNGGAFSPWLNTSATSVVFTGNPGHTYGFYSIAQDNAGNVEGSKSSAEATTTAGGAINVTSQVKVTSTGFLYSRATGTFNGTITVTNIGGAALAGPLEVVFTGLPSNVSLHNATNTNAGSPYITVASGLAAGKATSFTVQFSNPSNSNISYSPIVYSGAF